MERTWWPGESAFDSGLEQAAGAVHLTIPQRPERRLYMYPRTISVRNCCKPMVKHDSKLLSIDTGMPCIPRALRPAVFFAPDHAIEPSELFPKRLEPEFLPQLCE